MSNSKESTKTNVKYCTLKNSKLIWKIYNQSKNKVYLKSCNKKIVTECDNINILDNSNSLEVKHLDTFNSSDKLTTVNNAQDISNEIMLRHKTKLDALQDLDKFIDNAVLFNLPYVKIIHGKSGGIIRNAVHEYLNSSPHIDSYHYGEYHQGGFGVTIANLK